jgi:hypothetical protein
MKFLSKRFLALLVCVQAAVVFPASAGESTLHPDSVNTDPGWALNRVGEMFSAGGTYSYPDTTVPVRLYLIDTAVANPASFVADNPKLTFEGTVLIRGFNDPSVSTPRAHGTQLLSLIAGKETGVAAGTPIYVLNYDIYPNATTTSSLLSQAIIKAVQHYKHPNTLKMRAAICIATSSSSLDDSDLVEDSIDYALSEGIPVILSAGNIGQNASNVVPSSNGTKDGVICVSASNKDDVALADSNFGAPVDILAPGLDVRTRSVNATSEYLPMTGTSPAAALVAGAVLAELSINGSLTPAQVESTIKTSAKIPASGPRLLRTTYASAITINNPDGSVIPSASPRLLTAPAPPVSVQTLSTNSIQSGGGITPSVDADSDGIPDMVEIFHTGRCDKIPSPPTLSRTNSQEVQYKFPIAFDFFNRSTPFVLGNGYTWGIRCTSNFKSWEVPVGSLSKTTDANGQTWLIATFSAGQPSCFVQIEIHPPGP